MWNPTSSTSKASSSDNKQNIRKVVDANDCKCSGAVEQFDEKQQKAKSKQQTTRLVEELAVEGDDNTKLSDITDETIDSGFISGPQTSTSPNLDTDNETTGIISGEIKKLNIIDDSSSESQQQVHKKTQQQVDLDSGIIEEEENDDSDCDLEEQKQSNQSKMLLPHSVDAGIAERFCNLSLQNNPNASNSQLNLPTMSSLGTGINNLDSPMQRSKVSCAAGPTVQQQTTAIPQQITPANAWEKYYQQNNDGDTTLHLACIYGYKDVVTALIRMAPHPCLFNIQNDEAQTPLHLATLTVQPEIIRMLLRAGAKPTVQDRHGNTALHLACMSGEEQCVSALTNPIGASEVQLPSDLEIRNYDGERCVHLTARAGFIKILGKLASYGADINAREGKSGLTPLHIAIESSNEEMVNYLLYHCPTMNIETTTYARLTAYQVACVLKKSEMLNILKERGAEPLTPPDSDYDSSDSETDLGDAKFYGRFGDPGYFVGYKGGNAMTVV